MPSALTCHCALQHGVVNVPRAVTSRRDHAMHPPARTPACAAYVPLLHTVSCQECTSAHLSTATTACRLKSCHPVPKVPSRLMQSMPAHPCLCRHRSAPRSSKLHIGKSRGADTEMSAPLGRKRAVGIGGGDGAECHRPLACLNKCAASLNDSTICAGLVHVSSVCPPSSLLQARAPPGALRGEKERAVPGALRDCGMSPSCNGFMLLSAPHMAIRRTAKRAL